MPQFGLFDLAQKAWLHVCDTRQEAEQKRIEADVSSAIVAPFTADAPAKPDGAKEPQQEVNVHPGA